LLAGLVAQVRERVGPPAVAIVARCAAHPVQARAAIAAAHRCLADRASALRARGRPCCPGSGSSPWTAASPSRNPRPCATFS